MKLKVRRTKNKEYILYNESNGKHSHFKRYDTACMVRRLIHEGKLPRKKHFQESCRRILSKKEFDRLK